MALIQSLTGISILVPGDSTAAQLSGKPLSFNWDRILVKDGKS